ncbi:hypothetical protein CQW23_32777 [Capsicum baccatum]|uniref:peptidylprolyl isomerase n=1 Tax=Capsicum baccatum TaxID=33114 RepID=A0A2G2V3Q9_CAPBA|nr:hypothetical protein CQW23_32777 [Capsicum baccatum]
MCFFFSSPLSTQSISDKKKKKKKKKSRHNGKQEVEQDKPSLVESLDSGLVIEELSKGKPRGKKAFVGFKLILFDERVVFTSVISNNFLLLNRYGDQGHGGVIPPDSWLVCVDHALSLRVMVRFRSESSNSIKFEDVAEDVDKDGSTDDAFSMYPPSPIPNNGDNFPNALLPGLCPPFNPKELRIFTFISVLVF